jgi:hypothetical protein
VSSLVEEEFLDGDFQITAVSAKIVSDFPLDLKKEFEMTMISAPEPIVHELQRVAKEFLTKMQEEDYDFVWNSLISLESAAILSTALFPINAYKENKIDEVLKPIPHEKFSMSLAEAFEFAFQKDIQHVRSGFFSGLSQGMEAQGWYEISFEDAQDTLAFIDDPAALLIEPSSKLPFIMLLVKERGSYKVDLAAMTLFSMYVSASMIYKIGERALEIGQRKSAIAYFELASSFSQAYPRIRQFLIDHPIVQTIITDTRKQELLEEEKYLVLARHQVLTLLSNPEVSPRPINMGEFLQKTFRGYSEIATTTLDNQELSKLYSLNDKELREAIAFILNGVNPVVAQREAKKPHGPYEISDMELVVQHGNEIYRLSMPFKSALEIKEDSVPVSVAYHSWFGHF